jgi:hypothetical protein
VTKMQPLVTSADGRRSNLKDSTREEQNKEVSDRQCSHLKDSPSYLALTN